ncbi:MAG: FAD-dependent oxidoreductase, partial [Dehalococcoidales bacterium]|nr:FAD-dependent oxidoreductase [Dehalococcoidales bacterium]
MTKKNETIKYLIIGNSAGGIGAAEAIREVDKAGTITIVSDEPYPAYSRPLISEHLADGRPLERILFRPPGFYDNNHIQTILGQKVVGVKPEEHSIELDDGRLITWEKLLLATGGLPIVPPMEGLGLKGIFTFTTLDDARAVDHFLRQHPKREIRAVVIGGGLIGISATEALLKRGVEVTIIEMKDRVLNAILDEEASSLEEDALNKAGVEIITGHTVSRITSYVPGEVTGVTLDNSRPLACEMVIVAIGVRPRTELVSDTGIKTNRGIIIDRRMTTSNPDVYACGDVAEGYDFVHGENRLSPVWPNAYLGGRIAGFNMAGVPTEYRGGTAMNSMKYFGVNIHSAGMVAPTDDSYEVISSKTAHTYKKVILKDGLITGMVYSSDIEKSGIVYRLMKDRINVEAFKQELVAADF